MQNLKKKSSLSHLLIAKNVKKRATFHIIIRTHSRAVLTQNSHDILTLNLNAGVPSQQQAKRRCTDHSQGRAPKPLNDVRKRFICIFVYTSPDILAPQRVRG